jgi:hypothetical protein
LNAINHRHNEAVIQNKKPMHRDDQIDQTAVLTNRSNLDFDCIELRSAAGHHRNVTRHRHSQNDHQHQGRMQRCSQSSELKHGVHLFAD